MAFWMKIHIKVAFFYVNTNGILDENNNGILDEKILAFWMKIHIKVAFFM